MYLRDIKPGQIFQRNYTEEFMFQARLKEYDDNLLDELLEFRIIDNFNEEILEWTTATILTLKDLDDLWEKV